MAHRTLVLAAFVLVVLALAPPVEAVCTGICRETGHGGISCGFRVFGMGSLCSSECTTQGTTTTCYCIELECLSGEPPLEEGAALAQSCPSPGDHPAPAPLHEVVELAPRT